MDDDGPCERAMDVSEDIRTMGWIAEKGIGPAYVNMMGKSWKRGDVVGWEGDNRQGTD